MNWNLGTIPAEMKSASQWVLWKFEEREGKKVKVPKQVDGRYASTDRPGTWSSFKAVEHHYRNYPNQFDGIGFVFTEQDDFIGIDIDKCIDASGEISAAAKYIIDEIDSYTEYSPSGKGFHIIARGELPEWFTGTGKKNDKEGIEIYRSKRFFTVTGNTENDNRIEERTDELLSICDNFFSHIEDELPLIEVDFDEYRQERFEDEKIIDMMFHSKKNGDLIRRMFEGEDTKDNNASNTDLVFCNHLAFWADKNPVQMDRIFRKSGRMRDKWDRRTGDSTYGRDTITKAIRDTKHTLKGSQEEKSLFIKIKEAEKQAESLDEDDRPQLLKSSIFPTSIFPPDIKTYVDMSSEAVNAPKDFVAIGVLAVISTMIGNQAKIQVTSEWFENCMMYAAFIGTPGVRKTPALKKAMMPLDRIQKNLDRDFEQKEQNYLQELAKYDMELNEFQRDLKKAKVTVEDVPSEPQMPSRKQIKVNDITVETVVEMMADNSLLMERDEFVGWIKSMNQYKGGSGGERQAYLEFWNGNRVDVNRKGGRHISVESPFVSIVGGIQPARLTEVLSDNIDDGFVERILFSYPDEFPIIELKDLHIPDEIKSAYTDACDTLYYRLKNDGDDTEIIRLDPKAAAAFKKYYNALNAEIRTPEFNSILEGAWIKLTGYFARFTLILHCLHWACRSELAPRKNDISPEIVKLAVDLIEYYKSHTTKVYSFLVADEVDNKLKKVAEWIIEKMPDRKCMARDLQRGKVCGVKKKAEAEQLIVELVESGFGSVSEEVAKNNKTVQIFTLEI